MVGTILYVGTGHGTKWTPKNRCRNLENKPIYGHIFQGMILCFSLSIKNMVIYLFRLQKFLPKSILVGNIFLKVSF